MVFPCFFAQAELLKNGRPGISQVAKNALRILAFGAKPL